MEVELLSGQRQKGESDASAIACNDWLRLGTGRTLAALLTKYTEMHGATPPTTSMDTLKRWSANFDWSSRATQFDASWEARKTAEREAVMNYGLSLDYERTRKLLRLADFLEDQIYELSAPDADGNRTHHNVWVPDVKSIGSGLFAERVDIERFNAPIFDQYRGVLDDIAKETGGRIKKSDITSGGKPLPIMVTKMDMDEL